MRETFFDQLERRGRIQGKQETLSRLLQAKFGALDQKIIDRVQKIESEEKLTNLFEEALTASSLNELRLDNAVLDSILSHFFDKTPVARAFRAQIGTSGTLVLPCIYENSAKV